MTMEKTIILCDQCHDEIKTINNHDVYIELPKGDLVNHGIWFGHLEKHLWFNDEKFCSYGCFLKFIAKWYAAQEPT